MKHLFLPYAIAKQLKEKGFNEMVMAYYNQNLELKPVDTDFDSHRKIDEHHCIKAPLYQQVVDWFREKHKTHIQIYRQSISDAYCFKIINETHMEATFNFHIEYLTYYEALTKAIEEALKII